jgi:hypothetical protein
MEEKKTMEQNIELLLSIINLELDLHMYELEDSLFN